MHDKRFPRCLEFTPFLPFAFLASLKLATERIFGAKNALNERKWQTKECTDLAFADDREVTTDMGVLRPRPTKKKPTGRARTHPGIRPVSSGGSSGGRRRGFGRHGSHHCHRHEDTESTTPKKFMKRKGNLKKRALMIMDPTCPHSHLVRLWHA
ncbi:hypothetical protein CEXT_270431 [Caerostris extrusa]|uniref:Uncharacterized protein n=1 Tax=Caerostris extrusa TaxID=172846 RepID=A0AAV4XP29_CAEEX|nr:hypothetical protein CEXT_270431 [Caerostris extrusa]